MNQWINYIGNIHIDKTVQVWKVISVKSFALIQRKANQWKKWVGRKFKYLVLQMRGIDR